MASPTGCRIPKSSTSGTVTVTVQPGSTTHRRPGGRFPYVMNTEDTTLTRSIFVTGGLEPTSTDHGGDRR